MQDTRKVIDDLIVCENQQVNVVLKRRNMEVVKHIIVYVEGDIEGRRFHVLTLNGGKLLRLTLMGIQKKVAKFESYGYFFRRAKHEDHYRL